MKHSLKTHQVAVGLAAASLVVSASTLADATGQPPSCIISGSIEITEPEASYQVADFDLDTRHGSIGWAVVQPSGMCIFVK